MQAGQDRRKRRWLVGMGGVLCCVLLAASPCSAQRVFASPENVSQSADNSRVVSLAIQGRGTDPSVARAFWHDFTGATNVLWCSEYARGAWSPGAPCEPNSERAWSPRAVADLEGRVHLVWRGRVAGVDDIYYSQRDGGSWSLPTNVSNMAEASANPSLAVTPDGLLVAWEQQVGADTRFYEAVHDGTAWEPANDTGLPYAGGRSGTIRVAADRSGTVHAVWHDIVGTFYEVRHSERSAEDGVWTAPESVSRSPFEDSVEPSLGVDFSGEVHVAWIEQDAVDGGIFEVAYSSRAPGGSWAFTQNLSNMRGSAFLPSLAVTQGGTTRVAWRGLTGGGSAIFYVDSVGATPQSLSTMEGANPANVSLALDRGGYPGVAWEEAVVTGNYEIAVTRGCADAEWSCCDGTDNDCDGQVDFDDSDCSVAPDCFDPEMACSNGVDDDGDGFIDCADPDCMGTPACFDADGDGVGDGLDCAPADPTAFAVPAPVAGLEVTGGVFPSVELTWIGVADAGTGTTYEVAGASLEALHLDRAADGPCLEVELLTTAWTDTAPAVGDSRYYLVRASNSCGPLPGEGWGLSSGGLQRPACP